jgi:hypothetical protein
MDLPGRLAMTVKRYFLVFPQMLMFLNHSKKTRGLGPLLPAPNAWSSTSFAREPVPKDEKLYICKTMLLQELVHRPPDLIVRRLPHGCHTRLPRSRALHVISLVI